MHLARNMQTPALGSNAMLQIQLDSYPGMLKFAVYVAVG